MPNRPAALFGDLFPLLLKQARRGLRKSTKEAVRRIDATHIRLSALLADWARVDHCNSGVKVSFVYDPHAALPVRYEIGPARRNYIVTAKQFPIEAGATYVFDMGYYSFQWWARLDAAGCRFVTRLKSHTTTRVLEERPVAEVISQRVL